MHIRKAHILIRHFFNTNDDSAGIFLAEEEGDLDWLLNKLLACSITTYRNFGSWGPFFFLSNGSQENLTTDANGISSGVV